MLMAGHISQPAGVSRPWEGERHKSCARETLPPAPKGFLFGFRNSHNTRKTVLPPQCYGLGHCTKTEEKSQWAGLRCYSPINICYHFSAVIMSITDILRLSEPFSGISCKIQKAS